MNKAEALYQLFSGFGLTAYEENSVYSLETPPAFPYLTYELVTDSFGDYDAPMSVSLWDRSTSWKSLNAKAEEISAHIGRGSLTIPIDGGYMIIMRGHPFAQSMGDPSDDMVKRKRLSFTVRYYTDD